MNPKSVLFLLIFFLYGCSAPSPVAAPASINPPPVPSFTPIPTLTSQPRPTVVSTLSPQATPFVPFYVFTGADNVVLRADPGYLFDAESVLKDSSSLLVLGRTPGGEWILVQYPFGQTGMNIVGWVYAQLLAPTQNDLQSAPLIQPGDVQLVRGHVADSNGNPISGVQFAFVGGASDNAPRNDAMTDDQGDFYAFMPPSYNGAWSVGYVALSCKSNVMDANCNCLKGVCGKIYPDTVNITLPYKNVLNFVWK